MDASELRQHICQTHEGINVMENAGDSYLIYDPDRDLPPERCLPFVTIVIDDKHDTASALDEPGTYRLNIGLTRATYTARFGAVPTRRDERGILDSGFDYTVRDRLMPHPVYAAQHWVCVVNPGPETLATLRPLLDEAHEFAARKYANQRARQHGS